MTLTELYLYAEKHNIDIDRYPMRRAESISVRFDNGVCAIALDPRKLTTSADETVKLAHELGHCETGSFYNRYSQYDVRQKHENRATKWAIKQLIPEAELDAAISKGNTEIWDLAEYFGVTEDFIRKAYIYYKTDR